MWELLSQGRLKTGSCRNARWLDLAGNRLGDEGWGYLNEALQIAGASL